MVKSLFQTDKDHCYFCDRKGYMHLHHVFGASNRKHSTEDGLVVYLCPYCHTIDNDSVHMMPNAGKDETLKYLGQKLWEEAYHCNGHEEFIQRYGRNYL